METQPTFNSCRKHPEFWMGTVQLIQHFTSSKRHASVSHIILPHFRMFLFRKHKAVCLSKLPCLHHPSQTFIKGTWDCSVADSATLALRREDLLQYVVESTLCQVIYPRRHVHFSYSSLYHLLKDATACLPSRRPQMESFSPRAYDCQ